MNNDPINPYSQAEQQRIMQDIEQSKRIAIEEQDVSRLYYLNHIQDEERD